MQVYQTFIVLNTPYGYPATMLYRCNDGFGNENWFIENKHNQGQLEKIMPYQAESFIQNLF